MKTEFSKSWISSKQPRKQRKYRYNAPLHIKRNFLSSHLSQELIKQYKKRNIPIRKGDIVKVLRGQFRGKSGLVIQVLPKRSKIYIENVENIKSDGGKAFYPVDPSNVMITELTLSDPKRKAVLAR